MIFGEAGAKHLELCPANNCAPLDQYLSGGRGCSRRLGFVRALTRRNLVQGLFETTDGLSESDINTMTITRHRARETVKGSTISQSSRKSAQQPASRFGSVEEEWQALVEEKTNIQRELQLLKRKAVRDNMAIRAREGSERQGIKEWMQVKSIIDPKQEEACRRLHKIEDRLRAIKSRVKEERHSASKRKFEEYQGPRNADLLQLILAELQAIHTTMNQLRKD